MTRLIQITDTHLCREPGDIMNSGINTDVSLQRVIEQVRQHQPGLVVASGDLAQDPHLAVYQRLKALLDSLDCPYVIMPGNHDDCDMLVECFDMPPARYLKDYRMGNWHLLFLNTAWHGHVEGRLAKSELVRMQRFFAESDAEYMLLFLHHHPVPVHSAWMDAIALTNAEGFWEIVVDESRVRGVVCGHVHQAYDELRKGLRVLGTPSTCVQFMPNTETFMLDTLPAAYRVLELDEGGGIGTRVEWVG